MIIGFNNGAFHRTEHHRISTEVNNAFSCGDYLELSCINEKIIDDLLKINIQKYKDFNHFSLHSPTHIKYGHSQKACQVLEKIKRLTKKFDIKNIVIHPDSVEDWSVFEKFKELPFSIENMDDKKDFGKSVKEIKSILDKYDFALTIDLQHCFVNDSSMKLAKDFHKEFKNRIVEYHISGFEEKTIHYPLFKLKQDIIIDSLELKDIPIVIESGYDDLGDAQIELEYIKECLK